MDRIRAPLLITLLVTTLAGCHLPGRFMRGYAEAEPQGMELLSEHGAFATAPSNVRGQVRFLFDDFGSLTTDNLRRNVWPWKLVGAALVRDRHLSDGAPINRRTLDRVFEEYGFIRPTAVANWTGPQPRFERPMGMLAGMARRGFPAVEIEVANLGCATCHAGPLFGADGRPTGEVWLGLPNASIDLSAYSDGAFAALQRELETPDSLIATIAVLFPEVSERELSTLRKFASSSAREQLAFRAEEFGRLLPGGPGLSNSLGSVRFSMGALRSDSRAHQVAWTSAPDLAGTTMRRSLLIDGVLAAPASERYGAMKRSDVDADHLDDLAAVTSLQITASQGVPPQDALERIPEMREVLDFLHTTESPPFPGTVDRALALRGADVFETACASCHGEYSEGLSDVRLLVHPNRLTPQDRMLTDSVRWATAQHEELSALLGEVGYLEHIEPLNGGGYIAPDLGGLWATAPYLHNGSVPTLWHLMHAEQRPERFYVGGHMLDYELMGIAGALGHDGVYRYPKGYEPWSRSALYDTREPGRSNAGHEFRMLTEEQKCALLEYLKVL